MLYVCGGSRAKGFARSVVTLLVVGIFAATGFGCVSEAELIGDPDGEQAAEISTAPAPSLPGSIVPPSNSNIVTPGAAGLQSFSITDGGRSATSVTSNYRISDVSLRGGVKRTKGVGANFNVTLKAERYETP